MAAIPRGRATKVLDSLNSSTLGDEQELPEFTEKLEIKIEYSAANVEADWRVLLKNRDGTWIAKDLGTIANSGIGVNTEESGYFHADGPVIIDTPNKIAVILELSTVPTNSGDASGWVIPQ